MKPKKLAYAILKLLFIDGILEFACAALAIFGIVFIAAKIDNGTVMIVMLGLYIVLVPVVYIFLVRKIKIFFKGGSE